MMSNISFSAALTIGRLTELNRIRKNSKTWVYHASSTIILPIGTEIPLCKVGKGCIGSVIISSITLTAAGTSFEFAYYEKAKAYIDMVNSLYTGDVTLPDEYDDTTMPGFIPAAKSKKEKRRDNFRNPTLINSFIPQYNDDDDDEYGYDDEY